MKEAQAIATLHRIGEDIIALADYLAAYYGGNEPISEPEEVSALPAQEEMPAIKLEDVRAVLAEISRSGKTAEMKSLLGKFGASKLSDVNPKDYAALLAAAKEAKDA